jgi:hypothetical protein
MTANRPATGENSKRKPTKHNQPPSKMWLAIQSDRLDGNRQRPNRTIGQCGGVKTNGQAEGRSLMAALPLLRRHEMTARKLQARTCEGCGKGLGTIAFAKQGYWHLNCFRKMREQEAKKQDGAKRSGHSS